MAVTDGVLARAGSPFPVEPVRTLDAIHLATALELATAFPDLRVLSFDRRTRPSGPTTRRTATTGRSSVPGLIRRARQTGEGTSGTYLQESLHHLQEASQFVGRELEYPEKD